MNQAPKQNYAVIQFDSSQNTSALGSTVTLNKPVDHVSHVHLVCFKITGLSATSGVPDHPLLFLDLQSGGERVLMVDTVHNLGSVTSGWIPLLVDTGPATGTISNWPCQAFPSTVSSENGGERRLSVLHAKIYDETGAPATFTKATFVLEVHFSSRAEVRVNQL